MVFLLLTLYKQRALKFIYYFILTITIGGLPYRLAFRRLEEAGPVTTYEGQDINFFSSLLPTPD